MRIVESPHGPVGVVMTTGKILRYADSMECFEMLQAPLGSVRLWQRGAAVARQLDRMIGKALSIHEEVAGQPPVQWVWITGDDHTYPSDILLRLLDRGRDVIAPMVLLWTSPFPSFVHRREPDGKLRPIMPADLPTSGLYMLREDEACGDAGILISRRVLEGVGPSWYDRAASGTLSSEDLQLVSRIRKKYPVAIDCEVSMGHMTPCDLVPEVIDGEWHTSLRMERRTVMNIKATRRRPETAA